MRAANVSLFSDLPTSCVMLGGCVCHLENQHDSAQQEHAPPWCCGMECHGCPAWGPDPGCLCISAWLERPPAMRSGLQDPLQSMRKIPLISVSGQ